MSETRIQIRNHGPLIVEGDFQLLDQDGKPFGLAGRTQIALCRCGQSENKPFCDGSHKKIAFQSECPARELPSPKASG